jgi:hypothetical protein
MSARTDLRSIETRRRPRRDGSVLVTRRMRWTGPDGDRQHWSAWATLAAAGVVTSRRCRAGEDRRADQRRDERDAATQPASVRAPRLSDDLT